MEDEEDAPFQLDSLSVTSRLLLASRTTRSVSPPGFYSHLTLVSIALYFTQRRMSSHNAGEATLDPREAVAPARAPSGTPSGTPTGTPSGTPARAPSGAPSEAPVAGAAGYYRRSSAEGATVSPISRSASIIRPPRKLGPHVSCSRIATF